MNLSLRGPLGRGFQMPPNTRRLALASLDDHPQRLLPLAHQALAQRASVVLYANSATRGLPEEVEVLPPDLLPEAQSWADFMALDARSFSLGGLRERLGLQAHQRPSCTTQVLVITAMPCSGIAECGVCAVTTRNGWALACVDGPVFDFNQLEG
jgi:dihydroorotate dehydrogenase electron transfer subunit